MWCYFGGWLILPVAYYPPETITATFDSINVIGAALPSNLGITKAAVVPATTLVAWIITRVRRVALPSFSPLDVVMAGFCLWPLAGAIARVGDIASAWGDVAYLSASWGASWALARGLFRQPEHWPMLLRGAAWSGVALLPVAVLEAVRGAWLYPLVWGSHPFLMEGGERTIGFRPLGFFEHGNQYGVWLASAAFAWLALGSLGALKRRDWLFASLTIAAVIVAQSVAGIVLLILTTAALFIRPNVLRRGLVFGVVAIGLLGAVYLSGALPAQRLANNATFRRLTVEQLKPLRIGSLFSRIRRDQAAIPLLREAPVVGTGKWDWWRPVRSHPWGFPLLLVGQFGLMSLFLLLTAWLTPPVMALFRNDERASRCALFIAIGAIDAMFNSFVYFPSVLLAAAIAGGIPSAVRSASNAVDNRDRALSKPRRNA